MTLTEQRALDDAIYQLRHNYGPAALAILEHLQEQEHAVYGVLVPMVRQEET